MVPLLYVVFNVKQSKPKQLWEQQKKEKGWCVSVRAHSQQAVLVLLSVGEGVLQGHSLLLGNFLQSSSLALLHLAGLLFVQGSHAVHVLLVGRFLLTQGLANTHLNYAQRWSQMHRQTFTPRVVLFSHSSCVYSASAKEFIQHSVLLHWKCSLSNLSSLPICYSWSGKTYRDPEESPTNHGDMNPIISLQHFNHLSSW